MDQSRGTREGTGAADEAVDAVIVGAGFAGMYQLQRLRTAGFRTVLLEAGEDVGGTWYWNRYPGARCDILSVDYSYSWDPDLERSWQWSERYATQPEILRYAQYVAQKHDLKRDMRFSTRLDSASWDDATKSWRLTTRQGDRLSASYLIMATGCLSVPKSPDIPGIDDFRGGTYYTGTWPREGVDFSGRRVAVIGTGSSAIQSIPLIAAQAAALTVFQRTPNFSIPAHNGPISTQRLAAFSSDPEAYREAARWSPEGVPRDVAEVGALQVSDEERRARYEALWETGELMAFNSAFNDLISNADANDTLRRFIHEKIRAAVDDPQLADALCPRSFYVGTKRLCLDTGYYETFNRPNVSLVDLREDPITTITAGGISTAKTTVAVDDIVFATGFDAMTGAVAGVDIRGSDGLELREAWSGGPATYLGLMTAGFPNLFLITGPGSPSVLSNMMVSIEQHVDWVADTLTSLRERKIDRIEPTRLAQDNWVRHTNEFAGLTLMPQADSWYTGANVPGKPRVFLPYIGGVDRYRATCNEVVERGYLGFAMDGPAGRVINDGIIRELKPDVQVMLETIAGLGLPPLESLGVDEARRFVEESAAAMPPGPAVGDVVDGHLPDADGGDMAYRLYRPTGPGPHPIVVYFHGGGWVLGSHTSDDALCRDLCVRSECIILSVSYRHAPESRFPAAADDGVAAVNWAAAHARTLGGSPDRLAVAGWSAGGNIAAVTAQRLRDTGPRLSGQMLLCPVTDHDFERASYADAAEGFGLTTAVMRWFWDHYCEVRDRDDPRASPLRAADLVGLAPALVVTAQFDPLRDEGDAYAAALERAGVPVEHLRCPGQTHTSIPAVGAIPTADGIRAAMGRALRGFFDGRGADAPASVRAPADADTAFGEA